ncbi:tyrosine-type recombinase/integrase [Serratia nevei]|uniref:phage integrase n=1 Tax=Serratia nevei TaxID=2703794 RepID=UPI002542C68F|nr:tyrosine-type recombinase/integrase [Serratia nevei]EMB4110698.1 tyrosine-type recombinase/integrase [Serratia marcescens]WIJ66174.1 tyrosine-type recombinase/integrase [Serratia nevei]
MGIKKLNDGQWQLDLYPLGRAAGKRIRKKFATKGEAMAFERHALDPATSKPWLGEATDKRTLKELIDTWYSLHGISLDDGEKRQSTMHHAFECMGRPLATEFNALLFTKYRKARLEGKFPRTSRVQKVSHRTMNLEFAYFRAMFNELKRLGHWKGENPIENVTEFKIDESEMAFLSEDEIKRLMTECKNSSSADLSIVVEIALCTGARWSEAEELRGTQLTKHRITFTKTKSGKNRTVPISESLYERIPKKNGALFNSCYSAFRSAIARTGVELPDGQLTHVLRHTFASHFMMNGGNILVLQKILGHSDIKTTMRYAHFSPDHLNDAVKLNPLAKGIISEPSNQSH